MNFCRMRPHPTEFGDNDAAPLFKAKKGDPELWDN
jgi:hypothetical protein